VSVKKIWKIGQYLAKIWTKFTAYFLGHPVCRYVVTLMRFKELLPWSEHIRVMSYKLFFFFVPRFL